MRKLKQILVCKIEALVEALGQARQRYKSEIEELERTNRMRGKLEIENWLLRDENYFLKKELQIYRRYEKESIEERLVSSEPK